MTIIEEIQQLKKQKDAVILAHYYVSPQVQQVADYVGDSFYLSQVATQLKQRVLVFCGVAFMGESAKILNPQKTVLMPDLEADCPMAHMATVEAICEMRQKYKDLAVVCYINSTAQLKEHADVCVTSSNAVKIVKSLPNQNILFIPDQNLARYVAAQVPEKNFIHLNGFCPVHQKMKKSEVEHQKQQHPNAKILAHPECTAEILSLADYVGSTSGMIDYATQDSCTEFIICTEQGIDYELRMKNPQKTFYYPQTTPICPDMKRNTLEKILHALKTGEGEVFVSAEQREKAKKPLEKMLELAAIR